MFHKCVETFEFIISTKGGQNIFQKADLLRKKNNENDVFYAPQPYSKYILDETTWTWKAPVDMPDDGKNYVWNDNTGAWEEESE